MSLSLFTGLRPRLLLLALLVVLPFMGLALFTFAERRQDAITAMLAVGIPLETAHAEANHLLLSHLLALAVSCLIAVVVAWVGGELFFRRYSLALLWAAQRLAAGDLSARSGLNYRLGEAGELARALDEMAAALERREVERSQTEHALTANEERYRIISELISDFAFSYRVEIDGTVTNEWFTEDSYKRVTGYLPEEIGTSFKIFHPEDEEIARQHVRETILGKSRSAEYRIITKGGDLRWLHIYRRPIWDPQQERVVRYIGVAQDITKRKLAEETLQHYAAELEQRVAGRTAELQDALRQEKQVNELKSRFSSMVTHEFRNPLAAIHLSSDVLKKYNHKLTDDKRMEHVERIQARVKFLADLLDDILTISKADTVGLDFNPVPLDLDALCRAVIEETPPVREDGPQIVYASDGSADITGDEKLLRQMFGNLLSNALKYSLNGGPVQVDLRCCEGDVVLRVADQGIGIPEADLKRLGDAFHRASNTSGIPGTGLGVAIAKRAAEAHGGSITIESKEGVGSTFTVRLPLKLSADSQ